MITPAQCRAARGLVDLSQQQLADAAKVGVVTVRQFEAGAAQPRNATAEVIQRALEAAGVEFTNGGQPGVRMKLMRTNFDAIMNAPLPSERTDDERMGEFKIKWRQTPQGEARSMTSANKPGAESYAFARIAEGFEVWIEDSEGNIVISFEELRRRRTEEGRA
jgi:transcriptional regulator with XRE-family HTH domain